MDCDTAKLQLGLYLDRASPSEDRAALDAHLAACSRCTRELAEMTEMVSALVPQTQSSIPAQLWPAIEGRLHRADRAGRRTFPIRLFRFPPALAASVLFVIGAGIFAASWIGGGTEAAAAPVDFGVLLDALPLDANRAFVRFLTRYGARRVTPVEARKYAPGLSFQVPDILPGGFKLEEVFALRFGGNPGIVALDFAIDIILGALARNAQHVAVIPGLEPVDQIGQTAQARTGHGVRRHLRELRYPLQRRDHLVVHVLPLPVQARMRARSGS